LAIENAKAEAEKHYAAYEAEAEKANALEADLSAANAALSEAKLNLENAAVTLSDTEELLSITRANLEKAEAELKETKAQLETVTANYEAYIIKRGAANASENAIGAATTEIEITEGRKAVVNFENTSGRAVRLCLVTNDGAELFSRYICAGASLKEVEISGDYADELCWLKASYLDGNGNTLYSLTTPVTIK
ncbi:MAG: hypothetical protein II266_02545, partial [Clostridia bacterium]|nr:hypothetical protein [Clostridia bacterium]